jgi:mycothiol synthase
VDSESGSADGADLHATAITSASEAAMTLGFVSDRESERGAPLLDEKEQSILESVADGKSGPDGWRGIVVRTGESVRGYAGVRPGDGADLVAAGEQVVGILLDRVEEAIGPETRIWIRAASEEEIRAVVAAGYSPARRLLVLRRPLDLPIPSADPPGGVDLRSYIPEDDEKIADLLAAAYAGTPDEGWDVEMFRERRDSDWFEAEDLIVAEGRPGDIAGVHWMKRRGGDRSEVYNLAVAPDAHGLGLGRALLREGLHHLAGLGHRDVILWVDEANSSALALYSSEGFERIWADVAFQRSG